MAKAHQISSDFWIDNYTSNLDPIEKLLFLYLLTSPHANVAGVYQLPIKTMAVETGIDRDMAIKIMERFSRDNKVLYVDGWVAIKNRIKFNKTDNDNIQTGVKTILSKAPSYVREFILADSLKGSKGVEPLSVSHIDIDKDNHKDKNPNNGLDLTINDKEIKEDPENGFKESLDTLIEAFWECNSVWCKNAGRLGTAREEFHQQLLKGYSVETILRAVILAPKGSKPWEIFRGNAWQKAPVPKGCLAPEDDYDEELRFDTTLNSWVCENCEGMGMMRPVDKSYIPHKRGTPLIPDGGMPRNENANE